MKTPGLALVLIATLAGGARAAAPDAAPDDAPAAGTPSNATATVSPVTVEDAVARFDREQTFAISLGSSFASGKFGTDSRTHITTTALGLRYATGTLRLNASVPYMVVRSAGTIFSGLDATPVLVSTATPGRRQTNDGFGDLTLGASYTLPTSPGGLEIEASGRVKLPTASAASHLSSGKTDASGGVQLTRSFGIVAPFVSATYRVFGDPRDFDLRNGFAGSAGSAVVLGRRAVLLASYHYSRAATRLVRDAHELFAGASVLLPGDRLRLTGFATAGLSSGAAATSAGLSLSVDVQRR